MGINETIPLNENDFGFRIYKLIDDSPLKLSGVKEISDFIIPPTEIYTRRIPFYKWLKEKAGQTINISIYSLLTRKIKEIRVTLNQAESKQGFLGGSINYENYKEAHHKVLHVLKVKKNSFAKDCMNLIEQFDYIIGLKTIKDGKYYTINNSIKEPIASFVGFLKEEKGKDCEIFIYNRKNGPRTALVTIPNDNNFILGCDVAYGRLHEFPMEFEERDEEKKSLKSLI